MLILYMPVLYMMFFIGHCGTGECSDACMMYSETEIQYGKIMCWKDEMYILIKQGDFYSLSL